MPKTQVNCPNCRQPIVADIEQLFDVSVDPSAKQRFLSGAYSQVNCQLCGYNGNLATPIVYHDPDHELLLTFVPPEVGLPRDEQERVIGSMINQVTNKLPQEKRKAYLFQPQSALTLQGLVERVLEADGITKEVIEAQQERISLIQRLFETSQEEEVIEIAREEDANIDSDFFVLLRRLTESSLMNGDQDTAIRLRGMEEVLLQNTTFGLEVQDQSQEVEAAVADLKAVGEELTRENLLELVINAPTEMRLKALVSLARPAMDYSFFQLLSERIDRARGEGRTRLVDLRTQLLDMTQEIDQQIEQHVQEINQILDKIIASDDVRVGMDSYLPAVDEFFIIELNKRLDSARQAGDLELITKLTDLNQIIEQSKAPPPEVELIEKLLGASNDQERRQLLEDNQSEITPEFLNIFSNIVVQAQSSDDKDLAERVMETNRQVLRFSMESKLG
ncbi:CpXC domain-containing protein [Chloroflexota bacterium]